MDMPDCLMKFNQRKGVMVSGHSKDGFTLLEVLMAVAVSSIAMVTLVGAYSAQQRISTRQDEVAELQQNIRAATFMLESDIRMAGFNGEDTTCSTEIIAANANDFEFEYCIDGLSQDPAAAADGDFSTIKYELYDGNGTGDNDLGRTVTVNGPTIPANKRVVAERIDSLTFTYLNELGAVTATLGDFRSVQIALTAKAVLSARSGNTDTGLKRAVTMDIKCRNLGL